jgi:hypothetical protein
MVLPRYMMESFALIFLLSMWLSTSLHVIKHGSDQPCSSALASCKSQQWHISRTGADICVCVRSRKEWMPMWGGERAGDGRGVWQLYANGNWCNPRNLKGLPTPQYPPNPLQARPSTQECHPFSLFASKCDRNHPCRESCLLPIWQFLVNNTCENSE